MTILYTDIVKIIFVYYTLPSPSSCPHTIILPCPSQTTRKLHQTGWKTLMGQIYKITTLYPTPQILKSPPSSKLLGPTQLPSLIVHEPDHHAIFVNLRCIHFNPNNQTHSYIFSLEWNMDAWSQWFTSEIQQAVLSQWQRLSGRIVPVWVLS